MDIPSYLLGKSKGGVTPTLQSKDVTITENGERTITPDTGYDGLSGVNITTNVSGGGDVNWLVLGYENTPQSIINDYNYSLEIQENWVPATDLSNKFSSNMALVYMPLVDTSITTNMNAMFNGCQNLTSIPQLDTSNVTNMQSTFSNCYKLVTIPQLDTSKVTNMQFTFMSSYNLTSIPLLDTSNVTNMRQTFNGCPLVTIPQLNTSKVTNFSNIFLNCNNLSNESLDNILKMCIGATSYTGTKTLYQLGFRSTTYSASIIEALPHYQDFINAGWTIGY